MTKDTKKVKPESTRAQVWQLWHSTGYLMGKYADNVLTKEVGISYQQFTVLMATSFISSTPTATDLASKLDRNPNTLSTILDRMEKAGLVKKLRDLPDRRLVRVVMTGKGKEKYAAGLKASQAVIEKLTSSFAEEELQTFVSLIGKLQKATYAELDSFKAAKSLKK
jgi:DNA-binding MarR family transcriptional regulator